MAKVPKNGVLVTMQQSGALFYYAGITSLRYDLMSPGLFDAYRATARRKGLHFWALVGEWELAELKAKTTGTWVLRGNARDTLLLELVE